MGKDRDHRYSPLRDLHRFLRSEFLGDPRASHTGLREDVYNDYRLSPYPVILIPRPTFTPPLPSLRCDGLPSEQQEKGNRSDD